ncbi:gametogenetin-binding protein 2-like [Lucilia cuprina]|uniref:gametogenetin-binding protein 2-like n=1 Tax=Lucilia cuprina TaxID=7375 RepID=UPI001F06AD36|nr:gametogenetin-binding protein 2-like [Lucilia cuprina]
MARLTYVYRTEDLQSYLNVGRRQLPVNAGDENLVMLMDLNSKGLCIDSPHIRGKELEEFTRKFNLLTSEELRTSLEINSNTFVSVLNQCVQCVGCRRRVERLFYQLIISGQPTLDPLVLKNSGVLSITEEKMKTPQALGTLLYRHHEILNNLLESKLRNKTRCVLHSLDAFRSKPFSETWREVWSSMKHNCRDELAVIETKELHEVLENYLKKHKFCNGCRTKIEKAYKILVGETTTKEKGYVAALYANIKKCHPDKHIHVFTNKIDFLDALIRRAEPEVNGSYSKLRERHAKTLEIAQEEVLTCVGMIMYERLRRVYVSLREEERACQVLAAVGVHALCRSFDMSVEKKQGISNLELLYQEISRAEKAKEHKREQKKLKKKKKKNEKKNSHRMCDHNNDANSEGADDDDHQEQEDDEESHENSVSSNDVCDVEVVDFKGNVKEKDKNRKALTAGQKDIEEDAGVECDHLEETHEDVGGEEDDDDDVNQHHSQQQSSVQQQKTQQQQQQKKKKQKQKQKLKTPQKKNNVSANNNSNNKKKDKLKSNSSADVQDVSKTTTSINTTTTINNKNTINASTANTVKCNDCHSPQSDCPCESDIKDSGYGSEPLSHGNSRTSSVVSSPEDTSEGSEVSWSDGSLLADLDNEQHHHHHYDDNDDLNDHNCDQSFEFRFGLDSCNFFHQHQMNTLSLQQMLDDFDGDDEDEENCYIPQEVVLEYQCQREKVQQKRLQLRETLRENFARLCLEKRRLAATTTTFNKN